MSAVTDKPLIPWRRFWRRIDESFHVGDEEQGFLTDPEGQFTRYYNPHLRTLDQLLTEPCLILCGDPGSGKTTELERTKARFEQALRPGDHMIWLQFRDIPSEAVFARKTFDSRIWNEWRNSSGKMTLLVDSVDEGLIKIPDFVSYLTSQLREEPLERLQLVLACRSAEWHMCSGESLVTFWGPRESAPIFELCPLRQQDARMAAETWQLKVDAFLQAIYERKVAGLAALPTTLFFLMGQFQRAGALPATHRELYEQGCQTLAQEHDPRRIETLRALRKSARVFTPEEIYQAASRVAALLLVCGKSAIRTLPSADGAACDEDGDLRLSDVVDQSGMVTAGNLLISEDLVLDAIGTGLFTSRGPNRFGFTHQTFAECLAAQYLSRLPLIQVRRLLCARDGRDEHIIPQLAETVAWVAGMRDDFFEYLLRSEPEVMLRSDVSKVQNQRKAELVEAVLERAKRAEIFDGWNSHRFYATLTHSGLARQLQKYVTDTTLNVVVRRMALKIAGSCRLTELTDVLLAIVANQNDSQQIRDGAAWSLECMIQDENLAALIPLVKGDVGTDPDDTIKGCALRRLVPTYWSATQTLPFLTTPKRRNLFGSYQSFLEYHLPDHVTEADLPVLLIQLIRWKDCFDGLSRFRKLADRTFAKALQQLDDPVIRRLAVHVWVGKERRYRPVPRDKDSQVVQLLEKNEEIRLAFVEAIINDLKITEEDMWHIQGMSANLLLARDLPWALERIVKAPQARRTVWAEAISIMSRPDAVWPCWDLFLERIEGVPELKAKFTWMRAWELDEPEARKAKAHLLKDQRRQKRLAKQRAGPDVEVLLQPDFADLAAGKTYRWIDLCLHLSREQGQTHYFVPLQHDLTEFPGWKLADDARKFQIMGAARKFLLHHSDGYAELRSRTNYSDPGYIAAWLLRDAVKSDVELRTAIADKWIDGLIGYPYDSEEHYQITAALAYELNPEATLRAFERELREDDTRHGLVLCLHGFEKAWDTRFSQTALELVASGNLKPGSVGQILQFVGHRDPAGAAACAKSLLSPDAVSTPALHERTIKVLSSCLSTMPTETWDFILPILSADSSISQQVFLEVAHAHHREIGPIQTLSEKQLADLYLMVRSLFPPETDPIFEGGFVPPRQSVVDFRGSLLNALEIRGTPAACQQFLRLADTLPSESLWLRWRYRNAVTVKRRKSWVPPTPQVVVELTTRPGNRLVNDEDDLVEVIIESLDRLQVELTQRTLPRAEDLWHWDGADTARKNFQPKDEAALSNYVARWLRDDLGKSGIVVGREVQPRQGQRTDIYVTSSPCGGLSSSAVPLEVVIEVKGCWHSQVRDAVEQQLVNEYLQPNGLSHGIYLVGWFVCEGWEQSKSHLRAGTYDEACQEVKELTSRFDGNASPYVIGAVVLDCRYPI